MNIAVAVCIPPHVCVKNFSLISAILFFTGNGPAGIALSLILSGHWPYFTGAHPDPYLTMKLSERPEASLLEQVSVCVCVHVCVCVCVCVYL